MSKNRFLSIIIVLVFFSMFLCVNTYAAEKYFYDGQWHLYTGSDVTVKIDGNNVNFDVPPLIIGDRTLIPARSIFESLGFKVLWDEKSSRVTIFNDDFEIILTINSKTGVVNGKSKIMDVSPKIVEDESKTGRTLIPLRFIAENLGYSVFWEEATTTVRIITTEDNTISRINSYMLDNNDVIEIYTDYETTPKVYTMTKPDRLVLDFLDLTLSMKDGEINRRGMLFSNIRYAYHEGKYSRIVIDLSDEVIYTIERESNKFKIILSSASLKNLSYNDNSIFIEDNSAISLKSSDHGKFIYTFNLKSTDIETGTLNIDDSTIKSIEVTDLGSSSQIIVSAKKRLEFEFEKYEKGTKINIKSPALEPTKETKLSELAKDRLVVLDAGHGGSDPGAVGRDGNIIDLYEKEANLDITLKTYEILKKSGARVSLTRSEDVYVELVERAAIANALKADIFVSIHNNSFTSPDIHGTMVYYYASDKTGDEGMTSKRMAQIIQKEIVANIGTLDRGIADGSKFVVLNRTVMPAVIVEGAFISNENDKELLKSDDFRTKMAYGIANGIIKVLNEMSGE